MNRVVKLVCLLYFALYTLCCSSCVAVKGYQKKRLADPEMDLTARRSEKLETSFQSYREGASGANGGKTGGGCGCN